MKGIYCITNKINGKKYIGQALDIKSRWRDHKSALVSNYHHNNHIQRAFNKYGESAFEFTVLEQCKEQELNDKEMYYIAKYKAYDTQYGYNKTYGGDSGRHTEETKQKISVIMKGKTHSEETRIKISQSLTGRKLSKETKDKMSESVTSKNNAFYGKSHTKETRNKIRLSHKGKPKLGTSLNHPNRKLTDQDVLDIVRLYAMDSKSTMSGIAKIYGVSFNSIRDIIKGITYTRLNAQIQSVIDEVQEFKTKVIQG